MAKIETTLPSPIFVVPIFATKVPVFPISKVPASFSSIYVPRKPSPIAVVTVVTIRARVDILKIALADKEKSKFKHVITIFFTIAKVPASLSPIYVPRKPSPVTTDYIHTRLDIFVQSLVILCLTGQIN